MVSEEKPRIDTFTFAALFISLVAYPVIYSSGIMGRIITPIFTEDSRLHWWYFWLANLAFHWIPFGLVWLALRKNREEWDSIGLNWNWFLEHKVWLGILIGFLIVMAFVMPGVHYGDTLPGRSQTIFMARRAIWKRGSRIQLLVWPSVSHSS